LVAPKGERTIAGTLEIPTLGSANSTADPKVKSAIETYNNSLDSSNKLEAKNLSAGALGRLYTPTIIATEQTRENVAFGTLTTADEVKSVVLPENGLIAIGYVAKWKSSVSEAGKAAVFIGANQLKTSPEAAVQEATTSGTSFLTLGTAATGLTSSTGATAFTTTGQTLASSTGAAAATGGLCYVFAAAGTYNISIQFKATSGSVTAKERKLWVGVVAV